MKKLNSLKVKMPLIISLVATLMIAILLIVLINIGMTAVEKTAKVGFIQTAEGYAAFIDRSLLANVFVVDNYSTFKIVIDYAKDVTHTVEQEERLKEIINRSTKNNIYVTNVYILTPEGKPIFARNGSVENANNLFKTHSNTYDRLVKSGYYVSYDQEVYMSPTTGKSEIFFMAGIEDIYVDQKLVGILAVVVDFHGFIRDSIQKRVIGQTGEIFAVDQNGNYAINKELSLITSPVNIYEKEALNIGEGTLNYKYNGKGYTIAFTRLQSSPWVLGIRMEQDELNSSNKVLVIIGIVIGLIIIVVLSIMIILFIRTITKPLTESVKQANMIANGDLTYSGNKASKRKDELGELAYSFNLMQDKLKDIITKVNDSVIQIKSSIGEVANGSSDLSHRTESQAASLEETASSMEEMASTIRASAEHSIDGNKMMNQSREAVQNAGAIIEATTHNIEEVLQASSKISDITKMIENIALQTNILALNAAVEAARAGDQGRGFAVVASEVRALAQTTQTSVKDIANLISNADEKIKKAAESANESKEIFTDIQGRIEDTAKIMEEISSTAIEQQSGVDQVNKAVSDMDSATQQNAALVEETTAATEALLIQADELLDVMKFFKTDNIVATTVEVRKNSGIRKHNDNNNDNISKNVKNKNSENKHYEVNTINKNTKNEFGDKSMGGRSSNSNDGFQSF